MLFITKRRRRKVESIYCEMHDRASRFRWDFFRSSPPPPSLIVAFDVSQSLLLSEGNLRKFFDFLHRTLLKPSLSNDFDLNVAISKRSKSFSVREGFNDCARRTSFSKSGWLFSSDIEDVLCRMKRGARVVDDCDVSLLLHAFDEVEGQKQELGREEFEHVPARSSKNSSSSDELILSSARDDCRDSED